MGNRSLQKERRWKRMASLQEIAREQAENLRTGAVWVIVWKTGRSWRAETVSLNRKTRSWGSMEDKERASAIIQADSQAVILNGADLDCEKCAVKEIAEEIRWQYEHSAITLRYILQMMIVPEAGDSSFDILKKIWENDLERAAKTLKEWVDYLKEKNSKIIVTNEANQNRAPP